jgi:hypothetical protein
VKRVAVAALVLAALLAVAARAVLDVPRQVHAESGPGLAARLVGAAGDIRYRKSLHLADSALTAGRNGVRRRSDAQAALVREPRRSQAANILGVLALGDSAADPANGSKYAGEAASAFESALHLDPRSEIAKTNLELLLTLKPRAGRASTSEQTTGRGKHGRGKKSTAAPGAGY